MTETYCLTILEARSPKPRCWQGSFLLKALKENPFHAPLQLLWLPAILGVLRFVDASLWPLPLSSHGLLLWVFLCLKSLTSDSYKDTHHWI